MGKPFSLQSPEQVAKEYGGNKQKIAQAAQMGQVDPTAAVLAGMFIDRMRSAQSLEQGAQPTVAQQVLAPPAPASAPPAPPASGAPPMGMAPPMAPPMAPQAPPMGMASGGLTTLPIPDDMFDEPAYGGGGIVAFAEGAEAKSPAGRAFMGVVERVRAYNARKGEADALRAEAFRLNSSYNVFSDISDEEYAANKAEARRLEAEANAIERGEPTSTSDPAAYDPASTALSAPTEEGLLRPNIGNERMYGGLAATNAAAAAKAAAAKAAEPPKSTAEMFFPFDRNDVPPPPPVDRPQERPGVGGPQAQPDVAAPQAPAAPAAPATPEKDYAALYADAMAAREGYPTLPAGESIADQKKQDFNMALAQMGFGIAAGTSPNALTNIGAGMSGAVPGMQKAMDRRREAQRDAEKADFARREAVYGQKNAARAEVLGLLKAGEERKDARAALAQDASEGARDRESRLEAARIAARSAGRPGETERLLDIFQNTPEGPARDSLRANLAAILGSRGSGFSPEEALYEAQLEAAKETYKQLGSERNLNAKQAERLAKAMRILELDRAAAADTATDQLVKKYGGA